MLKAVGYNDDDNARKAVRTYVPGKYRMRLGDAQNMLRTEADIDLLPREDTVLLKEPGLYCFLLRCKKPKAEPFMEWVVETVLPREVRKLASAIKEKGAAAAWLNDDLQDRDNQIQALESTNEKHQHKILSLNKEIHDLIKNRHVARGGYFDNVLYFIKKNSRRSTHTTLFDVNIDSLKNISDGLNFVTQT